MRPFASKVPPTSRQSGQYIEVIERFAFRERSEYSVYSMHIRRARVQFHELSQSEVRHRLPVIRHQSAGWLRRVSRSLPAWLGKERSCRRVSSPLEPGCGVPSPSTGRPAAHHDRGRPRGTIGFASSTASPNHPRGQKGHSNPATAVSVGGCCSVESAESPGRPVRSLPHRQMPPRATRQHSRSFPSATHSKLDREPVLRL